MPLAKPNRTLWDSDPLLTMKEVLAILRVGRSTFDTWRALGTAPECIQMPNRELRVYQSALQAWLITHVETAEVA